MYEVEFTEIPKCIQPFTIDNPHHRHFSTLEFWLYNTSLRYVSQLLGQFWKVHVCSPLHKVVCSIFRILISPGILIMENNIVYRNFWYWRNICVDIKLFLNSLFPISFFFLNFDAILTIIHILFASATIIFPTKNQNQSRQSTLSQESFINWRIRISLKQKTGFKIKALSGI